MNERIQELADQCTDQYRDGNGGYIDHVDVEKFAELIVQECIDWINLNLGLVDEQAREDLMKYFGVK